MSVFASRVAVSAGSGRSTRVSWPNKLVRLAKVPGVAPATLTDKLFQPRGVVRDDQFIYVTSDRPPRIVRVPVR